MLQRIRERMIIDEIKRNLQADRINPVALNQIKSKAAKACLYKKISNEFYKKIFYQYGEVWYIANLEAIMKY